ncbi:MAG: adenylate/guanylate cyclase domain-containing protein [Pseudomonadota bacterium]
MHKPQTRFTKAGDVAIAYQVLGEGPVDLVYASGWLNNIEVMWDHPGYAEFLNGLASKCRLIVFDKRGTGMSDRDVGAPTLEERTDDIRAVMDAVGSERAAIFGISEGGNMATIFAASYPERVQSVSLIGCFPCRAWRPDWPTGERRADFEADLVRKVDTWGDSTDFLKMAAPSVAEDPDEIAFHNRLLTQSASPGTVVKITRLNYEIDIRPVLPAVSAPALVLHAIGDKSVTIEDARYLANHLANGSLKLLDGEDHLPWVSNVAQYVEEITGFVLSAEAERKPDRMLSSLMMTDIVGSTELSSKLGDSAWMEMISKHNSAASRSIARNEGQLVKTMGDGVLANFPGPSRAVSCARELQNELSELGLTLRAAVHTGECFHTDRDVSGIAVTIAARILDETPDGRLFVSSTVRDLMVGSDQQFAPAGTHSLKGVPGEWVLHEALAH